jgi:carboxypeptidase T
MTNSTASDTCRNKRHFLHRLILTSLLAFMALSFGEITIAGLRYPKLITADQMMYRVLVDVRAQSASDMGKFSEWLTQNRFDVAGSNLKRRQIEVITNGNGIKKLKQANLSFRIVSQRGPGVEGEKVDPRYLNPAKVELKLKELSTKHPNWTRLEQIGTSLQGRPIWALLITKNTKSRRFVEDYYEKPSLIFDGMHHARELMTSEVILDVAETVLEQALRQRQWQAVLEKWNIWVVPMLNVDGNNIVWTSDNWWRKNARADNSRTFGVDLNRNYVFKWSQCQGSSNEPSSETYRERTRNSSLDQSGQKNSTHRLPFFSLV